MLQAANQPGQLLWTFMSQDEVSYFHVKILTLFIVFAFTGNAFGQSISNPPSEQGGAYPVKANDAANPCISPEEYAMIDKRIAENIKTLGVSKNERKTTVTTTLGWPLKMANGLNDCGYYFITNYVDQDPTTGLKDYNCGMVTYDGHRGNDICTGPYGFFKMDNDQVDVIAAAPGIILDKSVDTNFDRHCAMSSATANYVIIKHADGSCALYWHMKKKSVTTKVIGDAIAAGEYLGVVGSSGSSTAPHLHLELWSGTTSATLNDAYAGTCNTLNSTSWWVTQKPYTEPALLKVQVNPSAKPVILPGCDTTETPNDDTCYAPGAAAKLYMFIRNETVGMTANLSIINPDGTTFSSWIHNSTSNYVSSYWYWNKTLPTATGRYTFQSIYNGTTCNSYFRINCPALTASSVADISAIEVFPNPTNDQLNISGAGIDNGNYQLKLKNIIGQTMLMENVAVANSTLQRSLSLSTIPNGVYFLEIESDKSRTVRKVVKQD